MNGRGHLPRLLLRALGATSVALACSPRTEHQPAERVSAPAPIIQALTAPVSYHEKLGIFIDGQWVHDNGNGIFEGCATDRCLSFGESGDFPLAGNWRGIGPYHSTGVYRPSDNAFYLDWNGDGEWNGCSVDRCFTGFISQDSANRPVVGRWSVENNRDRVGIFRNGQWFLDVNGNGVWDSTPTDNMKFFGQAGDIPLAGVWPGAGAVPIDQPGVFRSGLWILDTGNPPSPGCPIGDCYSFGNPTDQPIIGRWLSATSTDIVGTFRDSENTWLIDRNGNGSWNGCTTDDCISTFGEGGQKAVVGVWPNVRATSDGDQTVQTGGTHWENSAAVVPPGHPNCASGRAFFSVGDTGAPLGPGMLQANLNCVDGACGFGIPTDVWTSRFVPTLNQQPGIVDKPGVDNVTQTLNDGSILHIRLGTRRKFGRPAGAIFVWRTTTCGDTWALSSIIDSDNPSLLDGHCALPQGADMPVVFRPSDNTFYLDYNANGVWDGCTTDRCRSNFTPSFVAGDQPVMGPWDIEACIASTGEGNFQACTESKIGMFNSGNWMLDVNGNGVWDGCGAGQPDQCGAFGQAGDTPIVGQWNAPNDNRLLIGVWRAGQTFLDINGNRQFDGCTVDRCLLEDFGSPGDQPVAGVWTPGNVANRPSVLGVFRGSENSWFLDSGNGVWDGCTIDRCVTNFGASGTQAVAGFWADSAVQHQSFGTFSNGTWALDRNGNGVWEGCTTDLCWNFGQAGDIALTGRFANAFFGGWDRGEATVDRTNGKVRISTSCDYRTNKEAVILSSNDSGASWSAHSLEGTGVRPAMPLLMSSRGSRLYVYGLEGGSATLWTLQESGSALSTRSKNVIGTGASTLDSVRQGRAWEGSDGIAFVSASGDTDTLFATYPEVLQEPTRQVVRVRKVSVTISGSSFSIATPLVKTLEAAATGASVTQATIVDGQTNANAAVIYWKETTGTGNPSFGNVSIRAIGIRGDLLTEPFVVTNDASGFPRTWNNYVLTGDYVRGASFLQDGVPSYLMQWTETPSGASRSLHAAIVRIRP